MWRKGDKPIEGYTLERFLGGGSFGDVWRAQGPGGIPAALKFITLTKSAGLKEYRGIQRVKQIGHANLLPLTGIWALDQENCVLSEGALAALEAYHDAARAGVRGTLAVEQSYPATLVVAMPLGEKSLWDRFRELRDAGQRFPVEELLVYIEDAAWGIDHLNKPIHNLGGDERVAIQHCDIKPANIMLLGDSAQICDFGLAHVLDQDGARMTATGQALGTIVYMSPECAVGEPTRTSDQYSLAITYYEMRTGELPFSANDRRSIPSLLAAHAEGRLELSLLPGPEQEVVRKATSVDPQQRYPSAVEMVLALRRAVAQEFPAVAPIESPRGSSSGGSSASGAHAILREVASPPDRDTVPASQWDSETGELATSAEPLSVVPVGAKPKHQPTGRSGSPARRAVLGGMGVLAAVAAVSAGVIAFSRPAIWLPGGTPFPFQPAAGAQVIAYDQKRLYDRLVVRLEDGVEAEFAYVERPAPAFAPFYVMTQPVSNRMLRQYLKTEGAPSAAWVSAWETAAEQNGPTAPAVFVPATAALRFSRWLCGESQGNLPRKNQWRKALEQAIALEPDPAHHVFEWTREGFPEPEIDFEGDRVNESTFAFVMHPTAKETKRVVVTPYFDVGFRPVMIIP